MVEISPVLVMAAPSDPLSHQLHRQHNNNPNANTNPSPNTTPWGTWEELLLGSAVLKHGADNWALVSEELQSRARASFSFTPEACRAGYHAIQARFGADAGREGGSAKWYEELRRLRVADLKRELEQYDSSIGTLENRIKRLQSEGEEIAKAKSSNGQPGGSPCEPTLKGDTSVSAAHDSEKPGRDMAKTSEEVHAERLTDPEDGLKGVCLAITSDTSPIPMHHAGDPTLKTSAAAKKTDVDSVAATRSDVDASLARMKQSFGAGKRVHNEATGSLLQHHDGDNNRALYENGSFVAKQEEQPPSSDSTLYLSLSKSDTTSKDQEKSSQDPNLSLIVKQEGGGIESISMHNPMGSCIDSDRDYTAGNNHEVPAGMGNSGLALQPGTSVKVGDPLQGDVPTKLGVSPSLKSVNIEECKNPAKNPYVDDDGDGSRKSDESQSLCSPRLKSPHVKRRRSGDGSGPGFSREVNAQDDLDDKRYVRKASGERNFSEAVHNLPVESADSTEGKGRRALVAKASSLDALAFRVKKETVTCKEEGETLPASNTARNNKDHSRKLVVAPMTTEMKTQSTSSTENSLHREVWGESVEAAKKETKPTCKRRRLMGRIERKHRELHTDDLKGMSTVTPHMAPIKTESLSMSHEVSESMQSPESKEEHDTEVWRQGERLSGDSRYEKSEVGSYVDGNEDISPMSRRNRREPKVSGKLIPLLESLRTICAHRCGHFFRHNHEPEENDMYYRIVRAPIDLGMIRAKLEEGQYLGSMHFFRDLLLMVNNALVYYPRDSSDSAAAIGLRECVLKEMVHVFETEALVKQEGPSFRKRDSKHIPGQGRRKGGLKLLSSMERTSRDKDRALKQSDVSTSIESHRMSHQGFASRLGDGVRAAVAADKGSDLKRSVKTSVDVHKVVEGSRMVNNQSPPLEVSSSLKSELVPLEKASAVKERLTGKAREIKEPGSSRPGPMPTSRDATFKDRLSENNTEKKAGFSNVGSTSKASVLAPYKGKEGGNLKVKATSNGVQPPVKRGVGRPPKHSQQQVLPKASEVLGVTNSTRKRSRR